MNNLFNLEEQANLRVQSIIKKFVKSEGIDAASARFVINTVTGNVCVHLHTESRFIKTLNLEEISDFFGRDYDASKLDVLQNYLIKLSKEHVLELSTVNVVLCEKNGKFGTHLYCNAKYVKTLTALDLLTQFYLCS